MLKVFVFAVLAAAVSANINVLSQMLRLDIGQNERIIDTCGMNCLTTEAIHRRRQFELKPTANVYGWLNPSKERRATLDIQDCSVTVNDEIWNNWDAHCVGWAKPNSRPEMVLLKNGEYTQEGALAQIYVEKSVNAQAPYITFLGHLQVVQPGLGNFKCTPDQLAQPLLQCTVRYCVLANGNCRDVYGKDPYP